VEQPFRSSDGESSPFDGLGELERRMWHSGPVGQIESGVVREMLEVLNALGAAVAYCESMSLGASGFDNTETMRYYDDLAHRATLVAANYRIAAEMLSTGQWPGRQALTWLDARNSQIVEDAEGAAIERRSAWLPYGLEDGKEPFDRERLINHLTPDIESSLPREGLLRLKYYLCAPMAHTIQAFAAYLKPGQPH
jgi:hypothetical protein